MSDKLTHGPLPLYYQAANLIRGGIMAGEWPSGSQLPTEDELARNYSVSRVTIRKAKEMLVEEGLIRSIQGSGCYVNDQETWNSKLPTVHNLNDIFHIGLKMSFKIHEYGMVPNSKEIKNKLSNPQDRFVFQIKGVRGYQGRPISYVIYHLPFRFGSQIPLDSLDDNPFIPQIEKLACVQVVEGTQTISLGRADRIVAQNLGLKQGSAILVVETVYFDEDKQPIEYVKTRYKDALPYSIRVRRS
jgi:GntR family transcriptional regulator